MNRRAALALLCLALSLMLLPAVVRCAAPAAVAEVDRNLVWGSISIVAYVDVAVAPATAWAVLTDYDRLAQFVPGMTLSRRISRPGEPPRVYQRGMKSWLLLDTPMEVVLLMEESPPSRIGFRQLSGNLQDMYGEWWLIHLDHGVRITYRARLEPGLLSLRVPGDSLLIEADIERTLTALGAEMLRRQGRP